MAEFADRMKSFTDHLRSSITMRNEALAQVRSETEDLRDRAQSFMEQVANEHRNRAEELHTTLATHREECRQKAAELRNNQQESLRKTRADLQHSCRRRASRVRTPPRSCVKRFSRLVASWPRICPRRQLRGMHSPRGRMSPSRHPLPCPRNGRKHKPTKGGKHRTEAHHA